MGKTLRAVTPKGGWSQGDPNLYGVHRLVGKCFSTSGVMEQPNAAARKQRLKEQKQRHEINKTASSQETKSHLLWKQNCIFSGKS